MDVNTIETGDEAMFDKVVVTEPNLYESDQGAVPVSATVIVVVAIPSLHIEAVKGLVIVAVGKPSLPIVNQCGLADELKLILLSVRTVPEISPPSFKIFPR